MTELWTIERVLELVEGDSELIEQLFVAGLCVRRSEGFLPDEVEVVRLARVLVRDLDVNWPGVEVILHLRDELVATQRQVADLLELLRRAKADHTGN